MGRLANAEPIQMNHKVVINISLLDNKELWGATHNFDTKYAAARVETGTTMKYFNNGIQLMRSSDFRKQYRERSTFEPIGTWVILISLASDLEPNGRHIVRIRNRTSLVVSCDIESIREGGHMWPDPGLALDPSHIAYDTTHVDYRSGKVTIRCRLPHGLDLKETPYNYVSLLEKTTTRHIEEMNQFKQMTGVDHYETKEGGDIMYDYITRLLVHIGTMNATAAPTRERLIAFLTKGDDPYGYVRGGVTFVNEEEFLGLMEQYNQDEAYVLRYKQESQLAIQLFNEFPTDHIARLKRLTLQNLLSPVIRRTQLIDYRLGLDDDEDAEWAAEYDEAMLSHSEEFVDKKWRDRMIQRWKVLQN